jgi:pyruvate ferredoxin oxidoreductase alpha subunit
MAFKVAENPEILTQAMVCLDGFTLSHLWEPVEMLKQEDVDKYLPKFNPPFKLDPEKPVTMGPVGFPNSYMDLKKDQHDALVHAITVIKDANKEFKSTFGRSYGDGLLETYNMEKAKLGIIAMGSVCGTIRNVINELNDKNIGLIKIKTYRPFPEHDILKLTKGLKHIIVIDKNISLGYKGALYSDINATLKYENIEVSGVIAGLGGRDIRPKDLKEFIKKCATGSSERWFL